MIKNICLDDYDISPLLGLLSPEPPCTRLSAQCYGLWEALVCEVTALLLHKTFRSRVHQLPVLSSSALATRREYQRAFHILALLAHAYVWGLEGEKVMQVLPKALSLPWLEISAYLGMRPVSTHAAMALWNWRKVKPSLSVSRNSITTLELTRGGVDESWFFLVAVGVEAAGGPALAALVSAIECTARRDSSSLATHLTQIAVHVRQMSAVLDRMREHCDPYVFYKYIRRHLSGWNDRKVFPRGLIYEGDDGRIRQAEKDEIRWVKLTFGEDDQRDYTSSNAALPSSETSASAEDLVEGARYGGASAAQSSLLSALDIGLGVRHYQHAQNPDLPRRPSIFLREMQWHMPKLHRQLLYDLERGPAVHAFVDELPRDASPDRAADGVHPCVRAYNAALHCIEDFRSRHLQIVETYIIEPARAAAAAEAAAVEKRSKGEAEQDMHAYGTGGAGHLISFLQDYHLCDVWKRMYTRLCASNTVRFQHTQLISKDQVCQLAICSNIIAVRQF
ncbi:hypothetical protein HDU87_008364 [Geranomyces variabilis]|uniref:Indoleamine 2,3-dioxygenase n=1 Tax=Geranomyces variabilis TaxID=109894 RepID=A0AAD5XP87_9FUNG|nr:hypothetical protein HDU87_008364 [Geranomyces variabilis]